MRALLILIFFFSQPLFAQWEVVYNFPFTSSMDAISYDLEYNGLDRLFLAKIGELLVSNDWGVSWDTSYNSAEQGQFREIVFSHPDTGYMVKSGGPGLFLRTYDAGETWETVVPVSGVYSEEATSVFVVDKDHLYFSIWDGGSGKIVWTADGGLTTQLAYPEIWQPSGISGMACKDTDTCVALSGYPYLFGGGGGNDGLCPVYRTDSCCNDWEYSTYTYYGTQKLIYRNWNLMYTYTSLYVFRSYDQFQTWDTIMAYEDINDQFWELHFANDSVGYLSTSRIYPGSDLPGRVLRTTDYGETWEETTFDWSPLNPDTIVTGTSTAIECIDENNCFLMLGRTLFRTTNGGLASAESHQAMLPLSLHPNPASTALIIEGLSAYPNATITTLSLSGQQVAVAFENGQANIAHLPPGIYLTTVQTEQGLWREKWVKL
jgi:hypothetical protein